MRAASVNKAVGYNYPIVVADVGNASSLNAMAARAVVVIACVGPFRFFGEPVVRACVESGAHYVDITGEPVSVGARNTFATACRLEATRSAGATLRFAASWRSGRPACTCINGSLRSGLWRG